MTEQRPPRADSGFGAALIAELGKKSGVCWLRYDGVAHPVWHLWHDNCLYVLSGGDEQPLPGIEDVDSVEVVLRSKHSGGRLVTWVGQVSAVLPSDDLWPTVTAALAADRLNLADLEAAPAAWAERSVVTRIAPTGELVEGPGSLDDDARLARPEATPATTRADPGHDPGRPLGR